MNVAVLGGGVTGLTAAWRLSAGGHSVRLLEAGPRLGGCVRTDIIDGWTVEAGPNSFQESPEVAALIAELGLGAERVEASPASKNRYIVLDGKLAALPDPSSIRDFMMTPTLSVGAKWRVAREFARKPLERTEDVSVGDFMRDHFGAEVVKKVVQPFVSGIYAGDPERLSARHAFPRFWEAERTTGSLLRAGAATARKRSAAGLAASPAMISFGRGVQVLTDALASRLPAESVVLGAKVQSIGPGTGARWRVDWVESEAPAPGALRLRDCSPSRRVPRAPGDRPRKGDTPVGPGRHRIPAQVASVFVGFRRDQVRHPLDGFGVLVPESERRSVLGIIFNSSLFARRAPADHVALTVLAGGALQARNRPAPARRAGRTGSRGRRPSSRCPGTTRIHPADAFGSAQSRSTTSGTGGTLNAMAQCEEKNPGLFIGGSARDGISLPDCVKSGTALAQRAS